MTKRKWFSMIAVTAISSLLILGYTYWPDEPAGKSAAAVGTFTSNSTESAPAVVTRKRPSSAKSDDAKSHSAPNTPGTAKVMELIAEQRQLASKDLLTNEEQQRYRQLINDPRWLQARLQALVPGNQQAFNGTEERQRIDAISGLYDVAAHGNHKTQQRLAARLAAMIPDRQYASMNDRRLQKSLIGDKVELLLLLKKLDESRFHQVKAAIAKTNDPVLKFVSRSVTNIVERGS
jgi:hypothetical protein